MWGVRFPLLGSPPVGIAVTIPVPRWAAETDREAVAWACGYCLGKGYDIDKRAGRVEFQPDAAEVPL
jgi:hypothetical protein